MKKAQTSVSGVDHQRIPTNQMPALHIPEHLLEHVAEQKYELYTAVDHASWRYIMRVSKAFFKDHAHEKYLTGLEQTGITLDRIPRISEMDDKLKKFGWRAVTVTGFIPPAVFLEFQSLSILPIACDMRRLEHLEYTPSPDIVHEAAGHAPIISDPKYASYLHKFGEIARKAIFAKEDLEVYEAVKHLSDIKEDPATRPEEVEAAYWRLNQAYKKNFYVSEAAKLSRLGWWSIEYGLVKMKDTFKIYGAGLLSSVSESYNAINGEVKKIPLTLDCVNTDYDITKPQPQLFYVEDFSQLEAVIDQLAETMAYKIGGLKALERGQVAGTVTTTELDSGLQISGIVAGFHIGKEGEPVYLQYQGPSQLAYQDHELEGHSTQYHNQGFGTPVGFLKDLKKSPADLSQSDMMKLGLKKGSRRHLEFLSGVVVDGEFDSAVEKGGKNLIFTFKNCKVTLNEKILFDPSWGTFDMACGSKVTSVFGGAADRAAYIRSMGRPQPVLKTQTSNITEENRELLPLYEKVREVRERGGRGSDLDDLLQVANRLDEKSPQDWLLRLEILEVLSDIAADGQTQTEKTADQNQKKNANLQLLKERLEKQLDKLSGQSDVIATLIRRGRELIN